MSLRVLAENTPDIEALLCRIPTKKVNAQHEQVQALLAQIEKEGEVALVSLRKRFDGLDGPLKALSNQEIRSQATKCGSELVAAIQEAIGRIRSFHESQKQQSKKIETAEGVICWRRFAPIDAVGLYIPGGLAPLFSSLMMLAVPAQISGCRRIVICTPPNKEGRLDPAVAAVIDILQLAEVYLIGGVQAIGLMAYGTSAIAPVSKIFGPGNSYVTAAKQIMSARGIAIDMPAGPSEVLVIADENANARFIAADLLSQCEHGPDSQAILMSISQKLIEEVCHAIEQFLEQLGRSDLILSSLKNSFALKVANVDEALRLSELYAPEHLILALSDAQGVAQRVNNAGSVFLGNYSAEVFGDYSSGPNHTLPTAGFAKAYSGVSCDSFLKAITFQEVSKQGACYLSKNVEVLALAEGLDAHALAARIRVEN